MLEPQVKATIHESGGQVTIDGEEHTFGAQSLDAAREAVIAHVTDIVARPLNQAVPITVHDPDEPEPVSLYVTPDGSVMRAGVPTFGSAEPSIEAPPRPADPAPASFTPPPAAYSTDAATAPPGGSTQFQPLPARAIENGSAPGWIAQPALPQSSPRSAVWAPPPPKEPPAQWSDGRTRLVKALSLGMAKPKASRAELSDRRLRRMIREMTWPRSVAVGVVNENGSSGKTPLTLCLAGTLASIRGGGVVAYDAARSKNGLDLICEGRPARCISELIQDPESYATPGRIAAFAARQTSFADVICSLKERAFDEQSVKRARYAIDRCYAISVADTGNAHEDGAYTAVTHNSDLLVIPVTPHVQSIDFGLKLIHILRGDRTWRPVPIVMALMQSTTEGMPGGTAAILKNFEAAGVAAALELPYEPAIAYGRRITLGNFTHASSVAWTRLAGAVVSNIRVP